MRTADFRTRTSAFSRARPCLCVAPAGFHAALPRLYPRGPRLTRALPRFDARTGKVFPALPDFARALPEFTRAPARL